MAKADKLTSTLFPTTLMGSLPRSRDIMRARRQSKRGQINEDDYQKLILNETTQRVRWQEKLGLDLITSGEIGRDNYVSFVAEKIDGVAMMSMNELLTHIDDKKRFEEILTTLDVPSSTINNPVCVDKLKYNKGLATDELLMMRQATDKPIKITLPGPYLMTQSMWFPEISKKAYASKEALGQDVIRILIKEIDELTAIGVEVIQIDEPVLTEVVFTPGKTRTFMCAALSEKQDPHDELIFATSLIQPVIDYMKQKKVIASMHVCRGNWSKDETTLLSGSYAPLRTLFHDVAPDVLSLEFSTPRAGEIHSLFGDEQLPANTTLGLGVINPRTDNVETVEQIIAEVHLAQEFLPNDRIWLNPDCGFATFSNRPVNSYEVIERKINSLVKAATELRHQS
ncbi:cobalamin-independent methionine synthase II family protein [Loigolactobacillus iwatensis]|uniref:cobalamin-independent methionine synthase II family protein n=1 Tax=Loigolactobacillus iwatensis TaxID=1267156 RepID=UPI000F7EFEF2|nr:cobalamin-independent methionine synthase II family protein [Loigolactobacillus iwatensis]